MQASAGADVAHQAELICQEAGVIQEVLPDSAGAKLLLLLICPLSPLYTIFPTWRMLEIKF